MAGIEKYSLIVTCLVFLLSFAVAMPAVTIQPKSDLEAAKLYPFEVVEYEIIVSNPSEEYVSNISFHIYADNSLAIVVNNNELTEFDTEIAEILPFDFEKIDLKIKALTSLEENPKIYADYGFDVYTHTASTFVEVSDNPIMLNAVLGKPMAPQNEENSVLVDLINTGSSDLRNIHMELYAPIDIEVLSEEFDLETLPPKQSITDQELKFKPKEGISGSRTITLKVSYEDDSGFHTFEKNFAFDIQGQEQLIILVVGLVIAIVVIALILIKSGRKKPKIDTSVLEEEKKAAEKEEEKPKRTKIHQ